MSDITAVNELFHIAPHSLLTRHFAENVDFVVMK